MSTIPKAPYIFFFLPDSMKLPDLDSLQDNCHKQQDLSQSGMEPVPLERGLEGWLVTGM